MQELLMQMLEKAKTDKSAFRALKNTAVKCQLFELAGQLREMEKELFPETEEVKKAKERAEKVNLVFRMVELNVSDQACWLIDQTLEMFKKKKGKFSIEDAVDLKCQAQKIFDEE